MDTANIYRFNGVDPFDNWTIKDGVLSGYYPRNSLVNLLSKVEIVKDEIVIVPQTVTHISGSCFRKTSFKEIHIPTSVKKICNRAFLDMKGILVVNRNSYAEKYAKRKGLRYVIYEETNNQNQSGSN